MDYKLLLDTAVLAGKIMLENGAEIYRVEDTIYHILKKSELKVAQAYVVSTGIMVTLDDPAIDSLTVIRRIRERRTNLNFIDKVNSISRNFCADKITLKEAFHDLKHMEPNYYNNWLQILATAVCTGSFSVLFGGGWEEAGVAFVVGILVALVTLGGRRINLNGFLTNAVCSVVIAWGTILFSNIPGVEININPVIIGSIMPLVPGAAITNAVRDMLQGDFNASGAKILEAFVIAAAIAAGVGLGFFMTGGLR
ncbi:MAG: threonine/serine exporter family protein [Lachnospiraceae bacterium]|nr:threonine/serine exporter family protein [Lachnospiraceae bacterium]MDD3616425.1 threonine/serine exporter family protein [Lachnospiraceae bacterium]